MSDLRARAQALLEHTRRLLEESGDGRTPLDEVPVLLEYTAGNQPVANTWSQFVELVLTRFLDGGSLEDREVRNNLALFTNVLGGEVDTADSSVQDYLRESLQVLESIWVEVYGA